MIENWDFQAISAQFQKLIRICNEQKDLVFLNVCHVLLLALQKIGLTLNLDNKPIDLKDSLAERLNQPLPRDDSSKLPPRDQQQNKSAFERYERQPRDPQQRNDRNH